MATHMTFSSSIKGHTCCDGVGSVIRLTTTEMGGNIRIMALGWQLCISIIMLEHAHSTKLVTSDDDLSSINTHAKHTHTCTHSRTRTHAHMHGDLDFLFCW